MRPFDFFICLLLLSLASAACSNKFHPSGSECTFYYDFSDQETCEDFYFINCTWSECVQNITTHNMTTCARYQYKKSTIWEYCSAKCCLGLFPPQYSSLQQCQAHLNKVSNFVTIFILSMFGLALIGAGLNKLFERCKRKCKGCEDKCKSCPSRCFHLVTFNIFNKKKETLVDRSMDEHSLAEPINHSETIQGADWKQGQLVKDHKCGVCSKMESVVRLKCKHWYHRFCASQLADQDQKCRVCGQQSADSIKVYCRSCRSSHLTINKEHFERSNEQNCHNCQLTLNPS